jgi:GxxExxY protein
MLLSEHRPDLIVGERVVVEVKSIERFDRIHIAQLLTYLRITDLKVGLLLNFNSAFIRQGIRRVML